MGVMDWEELKPLGQSPEKKGFLNWGKGGRGIPSAKGKKSKEGLGR